MATSQDPEDSLEALRHSVDALNESIRKDLSFGRGFAMSIVRGIGYTLGATIVASMVAVIIASVMEGLADIPVIGPYAERFSSQTEAPADR
jgi:hypothetical protein